MEGPREVRACVWSSRHHLKAHQEPCREGTTHLVSLSFELPESLLQLVLKKEKEMASKHMENNIALLVIK